MHDLEFNRRLERSERDAPVAFQRTLESDHRRSVSSCPSSFSPFPSSSSVEFGSFQTSNECILRIIESVSITALSCLAAAEMQAEQNKTIAGRRALDFDIPVVAAFDLLHRVTSSSNLANLITRHKKDNINDLSRALGLSTKAALVALESPFALSCQAATRLLGNILVPVVPDLAFPEAWKHFTYNTSTYYA